MVYVGLISYSLYLWHWPLIVLTRYAMGMEPITPYIPVLFAASLALGSLSYHFIEQPFRRGVRVTRKFVFSSSAVFTSVLAMASVIGLMRGGFEARFSPEVVKLDMARSPQIPFVNCDDKPASAGCTLGRDNGTPTVLLWGDSHLLAWAPALNASFARLGTQAMFVPSYACPPMLGVDNALKATCAVKNLAVKNYLLANPHINTVVMSAYWNNYFHENGPLTASTGNTPVKGTYIAKNALLLTIQWLRDEGKQVVLIGPVPVYEQNVPLALALEKAMDRKLLNLSTIEQRRKHASFFEVINEVKRPWAGSFRFLDPIQWMCADNCLVMKDGVPLYRDWNHLNVAGAMALEANLYHSLLIVLAEPIEMGQVGVAPKP